MLDMFGVELKIGDIVIIHSKPHIVTKFTPRKVRAVLCKHEKDNTGRDIYTKERLIYTDEPSSNETVVYPNTVISFPCAPFSVEGKLKALGLEDE